MSPPPWYALPAALVTAVTAVAAGHTHANGWPWWASALAALGVYAGTAAAIAIPALAVWTFAVLVADMSTSDP